MKNLVFEAITQAIDDYRLLLITDASGLRLIEPYLLFETVEGDMLLHGWQQAGTFRLTPPPRWCDIYIDDIQTVTVMADRFSRLHRDYDPDSERFHRVLYAIDRESPRSIAAERSSHRPPPRRGPPPGEAKIIIPRVRGRIHYR